MISNHVSLITSHESSSSAAQRKITYGISKSIHSFSNTRITCCSSGQTVSSLICACIATLSYTTATGALWFHFGVCNLGFCFCPFSAPVECESEIGFLLSTAISNLSRGCSLSSSTPARRSTTLFLVFREFEPIGNILLKKKKNEFALSWNHLQTPRVHKKEVTVLAKIPPPWLCVVCDVLFPSCNNMYYIIPLFPATFYIRRQLVDEFALDRFRNY